STAGGAARPGRPGAGRDRPARAAGPATAGVSRGTTPDVVAGSGGPLRCGGGRVAALRGRPSRRVAAAIRAEAGTGPTVPVHGDFYENQVWVRAGRLSGLLDIDTAGAGDRLDDLACLLGHLSVLAQLEPAHASTINRLGSDYLAAFEQVVDPADLRDQ